MYLQGLCFGNQAEVFLVRQQFERARHNAEAALLIFDRLDDRAAKADAYRLIGMVYRETEKASLAESRLRCAIELAAAAGSVLNEADATRELALLYQAMGRNQEALTARHAAYRLFRRLDARVDLVHVGGKVAQLEETYFAVVRDWGQSIESSDSYTYGHCERVAEYAVAVARELSLSEDEITTVRIGAYLHDVGKVRVPHEILNKPGPLTDAEMDIMGMHTAWGIELLAAVEFPWDIKPIIRWHHEKADGTGYPDRLRGEEIPRSAQIIGVADVFDALTTTRAYRPAMSRDCRPQRDDGLPPLVAARRARRVPPRPGRGRRRGGAQIRVKLPVPIVASFVVELVVHAFLRLRRIAAFGALEAFRARPGRPHAGQGW